MSSSPAIPPKGKAQIQKAAFIFLLQNKCVWTCPLTWLSAEMLLSFPSCVCAHWVVAATAPAAMSPALGMLSLSCCTTQAPC